MKLLELILLLLWLLFFCSPDKQNIKEKGQSMALYLRDCFPVIIQCLFTLLNYLGDSVKCRAVVLGALQWINRYKFHVKWLMS